MSSGHRPLKRVFSVSWKLALVAAVAGFVVYRLRFTPVPVTAQVAAYGPIASEVMGTGTLEPRTQSSISPKNSGLLAQVLTDQGERVSKGQLLATLDDSDQQKQLDMAEADLEAAKATANRAAADITSAKASALYAHSNYDRFIQLQPTSAVSKDELEKATEQRDVADAQLNRAELAKVEADRQVIKAETTLRYYQQLLANTRITAPFDALVVRRARDSGAIVVPGSEIVQIVSTEQMWVSAWVDETAIASVKTGQLARVVFRSEPGRSYSGTVTRTAPLADRETREFLVDVTVKDLPKTWAVGQRAEVYIQTASKDQALLAPQVAIVWQKDKPGLFVNDGGHAAWRNVELGLRSEQGGQMVEINKGLNAGETIVWPRDAKGAALIEGRAVSVP